MDATNIIKGISSEKPALDFVLCMEYVWSAYEVMGEIMMKTGAMKPVTKDTIPILKEVSGTRQKSGNLMGRVYNTSMYYMYKKKTNFELGRVAMSRRTLEVDAKSFSRVNYGCPAHGLSIISIAARPFFRLRAPLLNF